MKKQLLIALLAAAATSVMAQGKIDFGNNLGATVFRAPISMPQLADANLSLVGQGSGALYYPAAAGAPVLYTGGFVSGSAYSMGLFAGAAGTAEGSLSPVTIANLRTGTGAGFITTTTVAVPGVLAGNAAAFQIRVWNNLGGTLDTWSKAETAWQAGLIAAGKSTLVTSGLLGGTDSGGNIVVNPATSGWSSFNIYFIPVPEPSTFALLGLGALGMMIFRRK